jgi:hypothetical protein
MVIQVLPMIWVKKKSFIVPISVGRNIICNIQCNCDSNIYSYLFTLISEILAIRLINQKEKKALSIVLSSNSTKK